jgi:penicillin-binding protein 2
MVFLVFAFFAVLLSRLYQLQVINGKDNRFLADNNRIQRKRIEAPRGLILDRNNEVIAENQPVYLLEKEVDKKETVSREEALSLQSRAEDKNLKISLKRNYPHKELFAHAVGYLSEVTEEEFTEKKLELKGYGLGSLIGRVGLEAQYEELLKGKDGSELVEVDTQGRIIRRMGRVLPLPGKVLTTALDKNLQEVAAKEMAGKKGAVIASNPQNGEILVFFSSPSYDPNLFLNDERQELGQIIGDEKNRPLLNRVIGGLYQPGSTFKIVTSIAGLEEGKITPQTLINDPGVIYIGSFSYSNWYYTSYGGKEGDINVEKALARSTDTYFYKLGEMIGIEKLNYWAEKFNLDKAFGIDMPGELAGFIATPEWKMKAKGESWFLGNTYHMSIGQGDIDLTPLGVNLMTAVVASGGKICTPRMLKIEAENTPYQADCREIGIKRQYLQVVKKGMFLACQEGGTAWPFFGFQPQVACKTGTAETGDGKTTHAWFTVFAPLENPEIVLTVLVEKGGEGSSVAGPIAKEILKKYFENK